MNKLELNELIESMKCNVDSNLSDGDFMLKSDIIKFLDSVKDGYPAEKEPCKHNQGVDRPDMDTVKCVECGMIQTGKYHRAMRNTWFKNDFHARMYANTGQLPQDV